MSSLVDYADSDEDLVHEPPQKRRLNNNQARVRKSARTECSLGTISPIDNLVEGLPKVTSNLLPSDSHLNKQEVSGDHIELQPESFVNLQENVRKLLNYRGRGKTIIQHIGESSQFQNPNCLETIMSAFNINPYSSNFPPFLYDPNAIEVFEGNRYQGLARLQKTQSPSTSTNLPTRAVKGPSGGSKWDKKGIP